MLKADNILQWSIILMLDLSNTEEIILGDQHATYEGMDEGGNVIMHLEDGSYKMMSTEEIFWLWNKWTAGF